MISINRSFDRSVMTKIKEADEYEKYYRIGKSIAEAMKDMDLFMQIPAVKLEHDESCDPGFNNEPYKKFEKEQEIHRSIQYDGPVPQIWLHPGQNPLLDPRTGEPKPATCSISNKDSSYGTVTTTTNITDNTVK